MSAASTVFCKNHPSRETLLRCNRCDDPYCVHCLVRTPVGYRCKTCLNIQQAGFYTANVFDYVIAGVASFFSSLIAGAISAALGGLWLLTIFYAPAAGGAISELVWRAASKRRGRFIWLVSCAAFLLGSFLGAMLYPLITMLTSRAGLLSAIVVAPFATVFNFGFWIYIALAIGTIYARLR